MLSSHGHMPSYGLAGEENGRESEGGGVGASSLPHCFSRPGTTLVSGWAEGHKAPLISRREGRVMTNESAATGSGLAFQS